MENSLFKQDITKMNLLQLMDWIHACRSEIVRHNFDSQKEYYDTLVAFCDEWEQHFNQYKDFYEEKNFNTALGCLTLYGRIICITELGEKTSFQYNSLDDLKNIKFDRKEILNDIEDNFRHYYNRVDDIFDDENYLDYKILLHDYLQDYCFSKGELKICIKNSEYKNITAPTYEKLIEICKSQRYFVAIYLDFYRENYFRGLEKYDITKSVYTYFRSYDKCEKDFDKKMFVNLAFAMSLPLKHLEKLLEYNGLSISEKSCRKFDNIIRRAFKCGFSREMVIDLIEIEKAKGLNIPNLTKNSAKG